MSLSRRNFLRLSGAGAGAAAAASLFPLPVLGEPLFQEPSRVPRAGGPILLNSNENAYGPFPRVRAAMASALNEANRYPDDSDRAVGLAIARHHGVGREQVRLACGSTEILKMAANEFCGQGEKLVMAQPTFEAIAAYAREEAKILRVPLRADYAHDLKGMLAAMGDGPGLFYVCNPNNPTGSLTPRREIDAFIRRMPQNTHVLIDEAYHEYAAGAPGYESLLERPADDDRVLVTRTFSKVYAMAGLRLGYAVGTRAAIERLGTEAVFDAVNCVAAVAGTVALEEKAEVRNAVANNARDRAAFMAQCERRKLRYIPSYASFVMIDGGRHVREVIANFRERNILVGRHFPPMDHWCRISLGTPGEMEEFWRAWDGMKARASTDFHN